MRLRDDYAMNMAPDPSSSTATRPEDPEANQQRDDSDAMPVILGQASPLAAVQREIDHLLDLDSSPVDAKDTAVKGAAATGSAPASDMTPQRVTPQYSWHAEREAARERSARAAESEAGRATRTRAEIEPAPTPAFVDPVAVGAASVLERPDHRAAIPRPCRALCRRARGYVSSAGRNVAPSGSGPRRCSPDHPAPPKRCP